jgi:hypothetical protein
MSKITLLGILCLVVGCLLLGFQAISLVMGTDAAWEAVTFYDILTPELADVADNMPWSSLQDATDYMVTIPLYIIMLCSGVVLLIAGSFFWKN